MNRIITQFVVHTHPVSYQRVPSHLCLLPLMNLNFPSWATVTHRCRSLFAKPLHKHLLFTALLYSLTFPSFAAVLTGVSQIWSQGKGAQSRHSCVITSGGGVKCWGRNDYGELGNNDTSNQDTPVDVVGLSNGVIAIAPGQYHSCALTSSGGVKCWGDNTYGAIGDGTGTWTQQNIPVDVNGLTSGVIAIASGESHSCAVTSGGGVKCWGRNTYGELGDGNSGTNSDVPVNVSGLAGSVTAIALGEYHSCALVSGGVQCWGLNDSGQLGNGNSPNHSSIPVAVSGLASGVSAIAVGNFHACALTSGGGVKCWGWGGSGALGNNSWSNQGTPVNVSGLTSGVIAIALGGFHSCALTTGGGVQCWGENADGQLGNNDTIASEVPVAVSSLTSGVSAIALGGFYSCALLSNTGINCWGKNNYGQLGDNTITDRPTPVAVLIFSPEINVDGNNVNIINGDTTPSVTDNTDFGIVQIGSPVNKTFKITNDGDVLTLTLPLTLTGTGCSKFVVTTPPASTVAASGGTTTFTITYTPTVATMDTCTVSITNDDSDENPYTFAISGTGSSLCSTQVQIPVAQCQVLLDLYTSTNGPAWTDNATNNWNVTTTPCSWTGVTCSGAVVTQITRTGKNLSGILPLTLSNLTGLTYLDLSDNQLTGSIPSPLPTGLTNLRLYNNQLTGSIPTLPTSLTDLRVYNNQLTGNLPTLHSGLLYIGVYSNKLSGTIPTLPSSLTYLSLSYNAFTGTLPSFASLTGLNSPNVDLRHNAITGTYTGESGLVSSKQATWQDTQTVPPTGLTATPLSSSQVQVNWTPITYTADGGYYRVKYATTPGGPYTNASTTTANKSASTYTVTGLTPGTLYYLVVETFTPAHDIQQNNLTSALSQEVSVGTCSATTTVTSTADSGLNTLRAALTGACLSDTIIMNVSGSPITLASDLTITQNVTIDANNQAFNVTGGNFLASGRNFILTNASNINVDSIYTMTSTPVPAGNISLTATGSIVTQLLQAQSANISTGPADNGGDIIINAGGNVTVGNVTSHSKSTGSTALNGGDIEITSGGNLVTGAVSAYSEGFTGSGNSGNIEITVNGGSLTINGFVNNVSSHGMANNVTLAANSFLKVMTSLNGKSIIANGASANGTITITTGTSPFTVGDTTTNGTVGDIYQSATNSLPASPATTLPPYYPLTGININNITCQNAITVTSTADSGAGSLRDAIINLCPGGTITLNASPIDLTSGELVINKNLTLTTLGGVNQTVQRSGSPARIFNIASGTVQLNNVTIANGDGTAMLYGGGIYVQLGAILTLNNSILSGNTAISGGGIYNSGTLTVTNSTLSGNSATYGGGFYNNQIATVTGNTFSGNTASSYGGGVYHFGNSTLFTNNTFSGNTAVNNGGGIYSGQPLSLVNNTLSGNSATSGGGLYNFATLDLTNTLIANSPSGGDCYNSGTISTNTNNLIQDGSCSPTVTGDPLLGPLQNNGGLTQTFALLTSSPAMDAGDNASCPNVDQSGVTRPWDGKCTGTATCDIGAYEYNVACPPPPVIPPPVTPPPVTPLPTDNTTVSCQSKTTVTRTADDYNSGSLRQAITITCPNGLIDFADTVTTPIYLSRPLVITQNLTITGGQTRYVTLSGDSNQDGQGEVQVFDLQSGSVEMRNLIITHGQATGSKGAGIHVSSQATLTLKNCQLRNNQTRAIYSTDNGGGLFNDGTVNIQNSTFYKNRAWNGGGIYNAGTLTLVNSTIAEGSAKNYGGGIHNVGELKINNSTLAWNKAKANNSGGGIYNSARLELTNTLIARSYQGGDCYNSSTGMIVADRNLLEDGSCGQTMGDPLLGEALILDETTPTLTLLAGSPAIDAGDDTTCATTDQRGIQRPVDGDYDNVAHCDIGAYESNARCQVNPRVTTTTETGPGSLQQALLDVCDGGRILLQVSGGSFSFNVALATPKNVTLDGTGQSFSLTDDPLLTLGKNLVLIGDDITLNAINTVSPLTNTGGNLTITVKKGNLLVKEIITASGATTGNAGTGGKVTLTVPLGKIQVLGDILTYSHSKLADAGSAGNVILSAGEGIETGAINASAFAPQGQAGNGGAIRLRTAQGDIIINGYLHSGSTAADAFGQAGQMELVSSVGNLIVHSYLMAGTNGVILITVGQTFQALGAIPEATSYTLYAGAGIIIHHGGKGRWPFIIGKVSLNGTSLGIATGDNLIATGEYWEDYLLGKIQILTTTAPGPHYVSNPAPDHTLDFGKTPVGQPLILPLLLTNAGDETLEVNLSDTGMTGRNPNDFSIVSPTFPVILPPGAAAQEVLVQCLPSKEGERRASLQLSSNDPFTPTPTYELVCIGMPEKEKSDWHKIHSGPLHTPILLEVTVTNQGEDDWEVDWESITGDQAEDFSVFQTLFPLRIPKQGGTGVITVQCQPSARGIRRAELKLHTNDPLTPTLSYQLVCIGEVPGPAYDSWPAPGQTLQVNSPADPPTAPLTLDLTLVAVGTEELQISFDGLTGPEATDFTLLSPTFPVTLTQPGEAVAIIIECNPTARGLRRATLQLRTNDPVQPTISYELSCAGTTTPAGTPAAGTPAVGTPTVGTPTVGTPTVGTPASSGTANPGGTSTSPSGTQTPSANYAPSDFFLSYHTVAEHSPAGTVIGVFFTPGLNSNDFHNYVLHSGGPFVIVDDELRVADGANLDFNSIASYPLLVTSTNTHGVSLDKSFIIEVTPIHNASGENASTGGQVSSASGAATSTISTSANMTNHFEGIIRTDLGEIGRQVSIDAPERVQLVGKIHPLPEHLGKVADIIAIYHWQPVTGGPPVTGSMMVAKRQWLTEPLELTLFQGTLVGLAGVFDVSLGYQLTEKSNQLLSAPIVTLTVRPNHPPTALHLSANTIAELSPENTVIGRFSAVDSDKQDWFVYGLLDDAGHYFQVVGDKLQTTVFALRWAEGADREITVRSVDATGGFIDQRFTIHITPVVVKPSAIHLTRQTVVENSPTGTAVGRLVTESRKPGTYRYELLDDAQGRFQLKDDLLVVADGTRLDFEQQKSHTITVRVEDTSTHQTLTSPLTIEVLNQVDMKLEDIKISTPAGRRLQATEAVNATEEVLVELQLIPDSTQIGETVELLVFGQFLQAGQVQMKMLAGEQWQDWDGDVGTLRAVIPSLTLLPRHTLRWQGALTAFKGSGPVEFYVGYRRASGEVVYSAEAVKVWVQ